MGSFSGERSEPLLFRAGLRNLFPVLRERDFAFERYITFNASAYTESHQCWGRMSALPVTENVVVRQAQPEDALECGPICFEAFRTINQRHGFPCDFPAPEASTGVLSMMFSHPAFYCVVAESEGRIAGSNCLDERSIIAGVGPITVDPSVQNRGVGRKLMQAVLDRARDQRSAGVRLVQAAFHNRSLSLYASL